MTNTMMRPMRSPTSTSLSVTMKKKNPINPSKKILKKKKMGLKRRAIRSNPLLKNIQCPLKKKTTHHLDLQLHLLEPALSSSSSSPLSVCGCNTLKSESPSSSSSESSSSSCPWPSASLDLHPRYCCDDEYRDREEEIKDFIFWAYFNDTNDDDDDDDDDGDDEELMSTAESRPPPPPPGLQLDPQLQSIIMNHNYRPCCSSSLSSAITDDAVRIQTPPSLLIC